MGRIEKSIEIKAPPEKVWEMLALDRLSEWEEGYKEDLKSIKYTSEMNSPEDKYRIGLSAHLVIKGEGEMNLEITESLENEKIAYHLAGGSFTKDMVLIFILNPLEEGTKFTYGVNYEVSWGVFGRFLDKLFAQREVKKGIEKALENLKSILEK